MAKTQVCRSRYGMRSGKVKLTGCWPVGTGRWPHQTSTNYVHVFQRKWLPAGGRKGGFPRTCITRFELALLKGCCRFPQVESGGSYEGSKSRFSSFFFLVASSTRWSVSVLPFLPINWLYPLKELFEAYTYEERVECSYWASCVAETSAV